MAQRTVLLLRATKRNVVIHYFNTDLDSFIIAHNLYEPRRKTRR